MAKYVDEYEHRFTATGAERAAGAFDRQGDAAARAGNRIGRFLEAASALGPQVTAVGNRLMAFAQGNVTMAREAERVDKMLATMFTQKGFSPEAIESVRELAAEIQRQVGISDEAVKQTAAQLTSFDMLPEQINRLLPLMAGQAELMGLSLEQVGLQFGKAFGAGTWSMLKRTGVTLSENELSTLNALQKTVNFGNAQEAAAARGQQLNIVVQALNRNVPMLSELSETAAAKQRRMEETLGDVRERMGEGVMATQAYGAALLSNFVEPLGAGNQAAMRFVGGASMIGGALLKTTGTLMGLTWQYKQYRSILDIAAASKLKVAAATRTDIAAERTKTGVAKGEAAAIRSTSQAAMGSARAKTALARSGGAMGFGGVVGGGILGGAMAAGGGGLVGLGGAGLAERWDVQGWGAAGLGAGTTLAGAGQGYALAGPMGAVVGGAAAAGTALWKYASTTNNIIAEQEKRTGLKGLTEEQGLQTITSAEVQAGFAAMTPEQRARRGRDLTAQAATLPSGDISFRISSDQLLTSRAATNHLHLR